tara:strand:- start:40 stop:408 length:369 start_codon:yes stop_codon:yes gene_type:complete
MGWKEQLTVKTDSVHEQDEKVRMLHRLLLNIMERSNPVNIKDYVEYEDKMGGIIPNNTITVYYKESSPLHTAMISVNKNKHTHIITTEIGDISRWPVIIRDLKDLAKELNYEFVESGVVPKY